MVYKKKLTIDGEGDLYMLEWIFLEVEKVRYHTRRVVNDFNI